MDTTVMIGATIDGAPDMADVEIFEPGSMGSEINLREVGDLGCRRSAI
jgi:hypothetical protein